MEKGLLNGESDDENLKKNEKKTHFILKKKCAKYKSVSSAELFANVF